MARSWSQIRELYLQATGSTQRARYEAADHLGEAQRILATRIDVPELNAIDDDVLVSAGSDFVNVSAIDFGVFAVLGCVNKTEGFPMRPEPSGMLGRAAFLDTTGKPPQGSVTHYQRDGAKLYVRGTAAVNTTLQVRVKRMMTDLTDEDLAGSGVPLTPQQYDRALVHKAAELYYLLHPSENQVHDGQRTTLNSDKQRAAFQELLAEPQSPRIEEDRPRQERFRLSRSAFNPTPRSARRGF